MRERNALDHPLATLWMSVAAVDTAKSRFCFFFGGGFASQIKKQKGFWPGARAVSRGGLVSGAPCSG